MERNDILGKQVEDRVTGFRGIATCVAHYLNGCTRVTVEPRVKEDGSFQESEFFDIQQLDVIGEGVKAQQPAQAVGGPPRREAPRA